MSDKDRSASRGREAFSTGRGGIGNIRQGSQSRDARPDSGPDDFSVTRGREPISNPKNLYSTGRGGAGNIRSPSREVGAGPKIDEEEQAVIDGYVASKEGAPISTGRGGLGNISANRSRSRDPSVSRSSNVFSTGRGGAGNILAGDGAIAESLDEDERRKYASEDSAHGYHSTGRGGLANITDAPKPPVEHRAPVVAAAHGVHSTGRGGAGNIRS